MKKFGQPAPFSKSQQIKESSELLEMTPDSIRQWCSSLDISDIGVAAKNTFMMLRDMHQVILETAVRYEMLETLRPTMSLIYNQLSKHIFDSTTLSVEKRNKIAHLLQALQLEAAEGYRIVLDQAFTQRKQKPLIQNCLYRLISFNYRVLVDTFRLYALPPQGLWLEIHRVYAVAVSQKLDTKSITDDIAVQIRHETILEVYQHCLLLSLSNPFRFSHQEVQQLNYLIEGWFNLVQLKPIKKVSEPLFGIDTLQDQGPFYVDGTGKLDKQHLTLVTHKLVKHLTKIIRLKKLEPSSKAHTALSSLENMVDTSLLEKLYTALTQHISRTEQRVAVEGSVKVALGLSSIHHFLQAASGTTSSLPTFEENDESPQLAERLPVNHYQCRLVNQSTGGVCLEWEEEAPSTLNALELIGMELNTGSDTCWFIGTIQWLRQQGRHMQVGVRILSPFAKPIQIQLAASEDHAGSNWMPGLLLPELACFQQPQTLLAPCLPFKEAANINIHFEGETLSGLLDDTVYKAHHYKQFTVNYHKANPELDFNRIAAAHTDEPMWQFFLK